MDTNTGSKSKNAIKIQSSIRKYIAIKKIFVISSTIWERIFDPLTIKYFWYNKTTGQSQWHLPHGIKNVFNNYDIYAVIKIQKIIRAYLAKVYTNTLINQIYTAYYDITTNSIYYHNTTTNETLWKLSSWLSKYNILLSSNDQVIYNTYLRLQELEIELNNKNIELSKVRLQRYEELEPIVVKERILTVKNNLNNLNNTNNNNNAENTLVNNKLSKHMDSWSIEQLGCWLIDMKMDEYIPLIHKNRVDGLLFVNLTESERYDLGIINKFHQRKLALIMRAYQRRYENKKKVLNLEDDEDVSEYNPSELSDILEHEDIIQQDDDDEDSESDSEKSSFSDYTGNSKSNQSISLELAAQKELDTENITVDIALPGDAINFPKVGDIVRVRYTCLLKSDRSVVSSTKISLQRDYIEFVLGINQVIKGIDRGLTYMSSGERAMITITSEYAYGSKGYPPLIPPHSDLVFDILLINFRKRPLWRKPLMQTSKLSEKPFEETNETSN